MIFRSKHIINVLLVLAIVSYSLLAEGHFGHSHDYGTSDPGYCTSQCDNNQHFDTKPLCEGFPLDHTLGIVQDNLQSQLKLPVISPETGNNDQHFIKPHLAFKDNSRAPPLG